MATKAQLLARFRPPALNKVDVTRYPLTHPGIYWLVSNGYRIKVERDRVFLVREC